MGVSETLCLLALKRKKNQILFFVTLVIYIFAIIFVLCGVAGNGWLTKGDTGVGLWKACNDDDCEDFKLSNLPSWHKGVNAMIILGFLAGVAAGATFLWVPITAICHFVAGACALIAIIIYGAEYEDLWGDALDLGWAFALATLSAILFFINGGINVYLAVSTSCTMNRRSFTGEMP